jgi:hypothetical protein
MREQQLRDALADVAYPLSTAAGYQLWITRRCVGRLLLGDARGLRPCVKAVLGAHVPLERASEREAGRLIHDTSGSKASYEVSIRYTGTANRLST